MRGVLLLAGIAACNVANDVDRPLPFEDPSRLDAAPSHFDAAVANDLSLPTRLDAAQPARDAARPPRDLTPTDPVTPSFASHDTFGVAHLVLAGDVDGDGKVDLVEIGGATDWNVTVWRGDGGGNFSETQVTVSLGVGFIRGARLADIDGDGRLDLVAADEGTSRLFVCRNQDGTYPSADAITVSTREGLEDVEAADFDGDGVIDFATVGQDGNLHVLAGAGSGAPTEVGVYQVGREPVGVRSADLDGDGKLDLITVNRYGDSVSILLGHGDLTFGDANSHLIGNYPWGLVVADLDGDGVPDIAVQNALGVGASGADAITLVLSDGSGGVGSQMHASLDSTGSTVNWLGAADFDGDGRPDLIGGNTDSGPTTLIPSSGGMAVPLAVGHGSWSGAIADFDGNGKLDVAIATFDNGPSGVQVYLQQ